MLETVVGIEVHAELSTKSKIFCSCENKFGGEPNTRCCPVCLGLPGALPVLSREAVRLCIIAGFAMNCEISETVKMARKNYFYPDLPKGYQITQDETPLCKNGFIKLSNGRKIRIERIHIEEDAGKLIHDDDPTLTFIDYNRCGVPLIEIVTKPDIRSTDEAREFFDKIKTLLKFTGVSDCKMQEGSLRCDVNVSVKDLSEERYRPRVEYKNINSFGAALRAIGYEAKRQMEIYEKGEAVEPATMKWDDVKGEGLLLRSKENAADYRYFPEPDIPKIKIQKEYIAELKSEMPALPDELKDNFISMGTTCYEADLISKDADLSRLFCHAVDSGLSPKETASVLLGEYKSLENELGSVALSEKSCTKLLKIKEEGKIGRGAVKKILKVLITKGGEPLEIAEKLCLLEINDEKEILEIVKKVIGLNTRAVRDFAEGRKNAAGFIMGQAMKESGGRANPKLVKKIVFEILQKGEIG